MDYQRFYRQLYAPLECELGPVNKNTIVAIIGFDAGGPLNFCTFGGESNAGPITYVSCELAVRDDQRPNASGRYELMASSDSEEWVRSVLSDTARMTLDVAFEDNNTMDIGCWVNEGGFEPILQGLIFKQECAVRIDAQPFGVIRCIGITRKEMEYAQAHGTNQLIAMLRQAGIYPHTLVNRKSVV